MFVTVRDTLPFVANPHCLGPPVRFTTDMLAVERLPGLPVVMRRLDTHRQAAFFWYLYINETKPNRELTAEDG